MKTAKYRKYQINEDYFQVINSEIKAYILGLIATDGNVHRTTLSITVHRNDKDILERIAREMGSTSPLYFPEGDQTARLRIHSTRLVNSLKQWGIIPDKSFIVAPAVLEQRFMSHYWRGAVDGDGCIYSSYEQNCLYLCGSKKMVEGFKKFCEEILPLSKYKVRQHRSIWIYQIHGENSVKILESLYDNASIYIARKNQSYQVLSKKYQEKKYHSQFKGVSWHKRRKSWFSQIRIGGKTKCLGYFDDEKDAAVAYDEFVLENNLNRITNKQLEG